MNLYLAREQYLPECTLGVLAAGPHKLFTLESPWLPHEHGKGGVQHFSCVAEGSYRVRPYMRPSGERVWLLSNPALDVHEFPPPADGQHGIARSLVMIHAAEYRYDVLDGIGVGTERAKVGREWVLRNSRDAMNRVRTVVGGVLDLTLVIGSNYGNRATDLRREAASLSAAAR